MAIEQPIVIRLCISHFLSTWNSRIFEYSAVLFLASIFSGTLLPPSVYAFARALAAILLAPAMGRQVDMINRLVVVRRSIIFQRAAVASSCALFVGMLILNIGAPETKILFKVLFLSVLSIFACVEKLAAIMNTISVERDWVVVIAGNNSEDLRYINSVMRRIDLFCKMAGPLVISFLIGLTLMGSIWTLLVFNILSIFVEYFSIARVYYRVPDLAHRASDAGGETEEVENALLDAVQDDEDLPGRDSLTHGLSTVSSTFQHFSSPLSRYIHHPIFLPSFALSILYFTVLSFGGQLVAYLLIVGYTPQVIGILRTLSVFFELSATWLAPIVMSKVGPVRGGLWFINWQALCCIGAAIAIFHTSTTDASEGSKTLYFFTSAATAGLIGSVVLSRVGLWGVDLCIQVIIQEGVEPESRTSFSSVESAFQNFFELLSFSSTIAFRDPAMFRYPVALSANSVVIAALLFAFYVRLTRKHLIHNSIPRWFSPDHPVEESTETQLQDSPTTV
ncbi:Ferroporti-1 [Lipomyces arxii]|uniref:Ferroporti-1 n=1 Tax=Lipomyces arxii TaxID=56418 RepID=UPI0034CE46B8